MKIRALQIDLARQKENLSFIFSYIDFAKKYEYNTIFLYLENAVRTENTLFFDKEDTYSETEIREIVSYATARGMEIIPALETLGHLEKFFEYPKLLPLAERDAKLRGRGLSGGIDSCGCVSNPAFYEFIDKYVSDVCALFPSKYVHVGLDEAWDFLVCEDCQARIQKGESKKKLFYQHIMHLYALCKKLGKRMMMWDDFFEYLDVVDRLPRDIVMCTWNYGFVGDEPAGHWTNRIKKDWFTLYDKFGFEYIFCTCAHRASSTCTIDSFTDYAEKHTPIGALMTAWERNDSFYQGSYPCIAYAGLRWSDKAQKEDKIQIYADLFDGNKDCAELVASLNVVGCGFGDITKICECDYLVKGIYRDTLIYALPRLKAYAEQATGETKDILTDIYDCILEQYLGLRIQRAGIDYFDGRDRQKILAVVEDVKQGFAEIKANGDMLWKKYREGIKSRKDGFNRKYVGKQALLNKIQEQIQENKEFGVLYLDLMLPESYSTVRCKAEVEYKNGEKEVLCDGQMKSSAVAFDLGGCYHYRLATKPIEIEKLIFSVYGEGALYPTHFRYELYGKKFVAASVKKVCGLVVNEQKLLRDDTRFAEMGYDDGIAHMENLELQKEKHSIEIRFGVI